MTSLATLLRIQPIGVPRPVVLLYQNYRASAPILFKGENYVFAPFQIESQPTIDLQLSSSETMVSIGRSSALDAVLRANNDLKRAVVTLFFVQPGATVKPIGLRRQVSFVTREGATVLFTLKPVTDALRGSTLTKFFSVTDFPELPKYKPRI